MSILTNPPIFIQPPADVNDLRSAIECGAVNLLSANQLYCGTRQTYPQNFQQLRPRVDVKAKIGQATGRRDIRPSDGTLVYNGWRFDLAMNIVTGLSFDGSEITHSQMVSLVRNLMHGMAQDSWEDLANWPLHGIAECVRETGDSESTDTNKGFEYTAINLSGIIIIRPGTQY